jgi:gamma-glutamyltranspeptidase / glutathione hydrolase
MSTFHCAKSPNRRRFGAGIAATLVSAAFIALAPASPVPAQTSVQPQPVIARHGMVAAQEKRAARVGADILGQGGNAVDAAVAVGFALAVTHPQAGNLGGGGFMLIHLAGRGETVALDYREAAPSAITASSFLDDKGEADARKSRDSALSVGVPGTVAGLALAHERYGSGTFTLAQLIAPALAMARNGIEVDDDLADSLPRAQPRLARWPSSRLFLRSDGRVLGERDELVQADLAAALEAIAREGPRAFYEGWIGERIVAGLRAAGGVMTRDDLARYRPLLRQAIRGTYRGYDVLSMPPPSSGGVVLIEMLNILEAFPLADLDAGASAHAMMEAMKLAYADRAEFLGDPDFVEVPFARLTDKTYAARLRSTIGETARQARTIRPGNPPEGANTTHYSVVDRWGNAVANTYSLNFSYGLGLVAEGTGILLNNTLDDFAAKAGAPNAYGLVGGAANAPAPGKRPLSSMTPTIVLKDGKVFLVTGSPGGSRIISTVLQVTTNVIDHRMNIAAAVAAPRLHHQWLPDEVFAEPGVAPDLIQALERRGHHVTRSTPWGSANSILVTPDGVAGGADPRTRGSVAVGNNGL